MDDRNCIATASFQLDSITNSMNPDSVLVDIDDVTCFGIYDGSIGISNVVGAVPPFTYSWNGPGTYTGTGDYISALYAGSYAVVIEDSNGCAITVNAEVDEPDQLEYTTYNVIDETCFGACNGQIWVNVTGGTGNYYYDSSENGTFPIPNSDQVQLINDSLIFPKSSIPLFLNNMLGIFNSGICLINFSFISFCFVSNFHFVSFETKRKRNEYVTKRNKTIHPLRICKCL